MSKSLDEIKKIEKEYHEQYYYSDRPLRKIEVEQYRAERLRPCYETGIDQYCDNNMAFLDVIQHHGGWNDKFILDYACGGGRWPIYYALTGATKVIGFDLAEAGVRRGQNLAVRQSLANKVHLTVMDAMSLAFPDNTFPLVIGNGVLHHVIKYPGVFEELRRVMQPGGKAFFHEGLADFPLWKLYWKMKGDVDQGDVPIHAKEILRLAEAFSNVEVIGDTFFFSVKTFLWQPNPGKARRVILKSCKKIDEWLFRLCPPLRSWGSFSYIVLTK